MKEALIAAAVGALGLGSILYATVTNAEVKGYTDNHGCWGECY